MQRTKIEWTDFSSNPIYAVNPDNGKRGWACTKVSAGCANCYSEKLNLGRFGNGLPFTAEGAAKAKWELNRDELLRWIRSRTPGRVFPCDMTDLYHKRVSDAWLDEIHAAMALSPHLTFQVLTKRPERMAEYMESRSHSARHWKDAARSLGRTLEYEGLSLVRFPLPNLWLGTSVENQEMADERIPHLLECPAAVRFLSVEPLLEEVNLGGALGDASALWNGDPKQTSDAIRNHVRWVICGGESGPGARPMHPNWVRSIRDQCVAANVPFFFKQWGAWAPPHVVVKPDGAKVAIMCHGGRVEHKAFTYSTRYPPDLRQWDAHMVRVGKGRAGRLLDEQTWNEMPRVGEEASDG